MEVGVKKSNWLLVAGLVIVMMAVGCKKMGEPVDVAATAGNPMVLPLYVNGGALMVGHVSVWDDASKLYVKYALDQLPADGKTWWLERCECDVQLDPLALTTTGFPNNYDPGYGVQEYTLEIPLVGGWVSGMTIDVAAHCIVRCQPPFEQMSGWAYDPAHPILGATGECQGWWFPYTLGKLGDWCASTAWGGHALPQWDLWQFPGNNWALYLRHTLGDAAYVGDLYAGNPKKDAASKKVGTVTVWDDVVGDVGNIYVTYAITKTGYSVYSGHTIVRGAWQDIPQVSGNPIPGHFDSIWGPFDPTVASYTVTIPYDPTWGTDLYVGAHAIVGHY